MRVCFVVNPNAGGVGSIFQKQVVKAANHLVRQGCDVQRVETRKKGDGIHLAQQAAADGREVEDGDIVPACAQACPTDAIVFGNLNDPESKVRKLMQNDRAFKELEDLGTQPKITYLKGGKSYGG